MISVTTFLRRWIAGVAIPFLFALSGVALLLGACGDDSASSRGGSGGDGADKAGQGRSKSKGRSKGRQSKQRKNAAPDEEFDGHVSPLDDRELPEAVFVETDDNRDPFRSFLPVFTAQALPIEDELTPSPTVILDDVSIESLSLIAIVSSRGGNPRAMVVDPEGKGWVIKRGDYVGRGERVRLGPGMPHREINWRVVRVRPDRIILVREDPIQAGPPVTRVMRLYPEGEDSS